MPDEIFGRIESTRDRNPTCKVEESDELLARNIRCFVIARKRIPLNGKHLWASAIAIHRRKLEKMTGVDSGHILEVWEWYKENYDKGGLPFVANGKQLAERWDWIIDRRNRRPTSGTAPVNTEVKQILDVLTDLNWTNGSDQQLPAVVTASYNNYVSFQKRLSGKMIDDGERRSYRETVLFVMSEPVHFLTNWFLETWENVRKWAAWNGDMGSHVWTPGHARFLRMVNRQWALDSGSETAELTPLRLITET